MKNLPKRIIYVDASGYDNNTKFKISLYDKESNATRILALENVSNTNLAEKYAILYALMYGHKNKLLNLCILCDNQSAVNDNRLNSLASKYSYKITWIPREINIIADRVAKLEPTVKESEWQLLQMFGELVGIGVNEGKNKNNVCT